MHGRTFEETLIYDNFELFHSGGLELNVEFSDPQDLEADHDTVFQCVKSKTFKKTEFALDIASAEIEWLTPNYIRDGVVWLEGKLDRPDSVVELKEVTGNE
jgi:hypothetical protein